MQKPVSLLERVRWRLEYGAARMLVAALRPLSPQRASSLVGALMALVGPKLRRSRRAHANLRLIYPEMPESERNKIVREMWRNAGQIAGEYAHLEKILNDPASIRLEGMEAVRAALEGHDAALLLSAHYGNWEATAAAGRSVGLVQINFYRPVKNPYLDHFLRDLRKPAANGGFLAKGDAGMREMMRSLREGRSIGMLVDQRDARGIRLPFLGREADTIHAPALIARRLGVPIFLGRARRIGPARFVVECRHIPVLETIDRENDAIEATRRINDILSEWIREAPEQWFWFHRRWPDETIADEASLASDLHLTKPDSGHA